MKEKFLRIRAEFPAMTRDALAQLGKEVFDSCFEEEPTVPMLTGRLRSSGTLHVDGKLIASSLERGNPILGTPVAEVAPPKPGISVATITFNTEYAVYQHEIQYANYTTAGSGPFYLSTKITRIATKRNLAVDITRSIEAAIGKL